MKHLESHLCMCHHPKVQQGSRPGCVLPLKGIFEEFQNHLLYNGTAYCTGILYWYTVTVYYTIKHFRTWLAEDDSGTPRKKLHRSQFTSPVRSTKSDESQLKPPVSTKKSDPTQLKTPPPTDPKVLDDSPDSMDGFCPVLE